MSIARVSLCVAMIAACGDAPPLPDAPSSQWRMGPKLPVPRLEPGVAALGQRLVVLGGFDTDQQAGLDVTTRVDVLDSSDGTWTQLPDAPVARHHVQIAVLGTTLYLLGGLDGTPDAGNNYPARGDCYALDTGDAQPAWRSIMGMPPGMERGSAAIAVAPPHIYLLGGASTTSALASNIYYDVTQDAWCPGTACPLADQLPDLPQARSHPAAMRRVDGTFVVVGGLSGLTSDTQAQSVFVLTPDQQHASGAWTNGTDMPQARGGCAYAVLQGRLVCAGGEAGTSALRYTESYDPFAEGGAMSPWLELEQMPDPRAGTLGAAISQQLYVPGGAARIAFEPTDSLYIFSPLDTAARRSLGDL